MKSKNKFEFADGTVRKLDGYQRSAHTDGCAVFQSRYKAAQLPPKVDMRSKMTEVEDQLQVGSCTANAVAGAYEYIVKKNQGIDYDASRLFIYYNARLANLPKGQRMSDSGSNIRVAVDQMIKQGCCSEETWEYSQDPKIVNSRPSADAYEEAQNYKLTEIQNVPVELNAWKSALAEGYPIIFGVRLYSTFDNLRNGRVPDPHPNEIGRNTHGSHAMLCVGYSDPDKMFIVRNSWGKNWGDNGYCYMSYNYLMNPKNDCHECWIIKDADAVENNEEEWEEDEESLFVDLDDEFANMSDEDWEEFNLQMDEYGFEYRVGALFLAAANSDGDLSDEEVEAAAEHLKNILKMFKVKMKPAKILRNCMKHKLYKKEFIDETVEIFNLYLSVGAKANIYQQMLEVANADNEISEDEEDYITDIAMIWFEETDDWASYAYPDDYFFNDDDEDDEEWDFDYDDEEDDDWDEDYDDEEECYDEDEEEYEDDEDEDEDDEDEDDDEEEFDEDEDEEEYDEDEEDEEEEEYDEDEDEEEYDEDEDEEEYDEDEEEFDEDEEYDEDEGEEEYEEE